MKNQLQGIRVAVDSQAAGDIHHLAGFIPEGKHTVQIKDPAVHDQVDPVAVQHRDAVDQRFADFFDRFAGGQAVLHGAHLVIEIGVAGGAADEIRCHPQDIRIGKGSPLRTFAENQPGGGRDRSGQGFAVPEAAQRRRHRFSRVPALLVHRGDGRREGGGAVGIVKAGHEKVLRNAEACGFRCVADPHGDMIVGADHGLGQPAAMPGVQLRERMDAAFDNEAFGIEPILPARKTGSGAIIPKAFLTDLVFIIVVRAQGKPEVGEPVVKMQVPDDRTHRVIIVDSDIMKSGNPVGNGDHRPSGGGGRPGGILQVLEILARILAENAVDIQDNAVILIVIGQTADIVFPPVVLRVVAGIRVRPENIKIEGFAGLLKGTVQAGDALVTELAHTVIQDIQNLFHMNLLSVCIHCTFVSSKTQGNDKEQGDVPFMLHFSGT